MLASKKDGRKWRGVFALREYMQQSYLREVNPLRIIFETVAGGIAINKALKLTGKPKLTEGNFGRTSGDFKALFIYPGAQVRK